MLPPLGNHCPIYPSGRYHHHRSRTAPSTRLCGRSGVPASCTNPTTANKEREATRPATHSLPHHHCRRLGPRAAWRPSHKPHGIPFDGRPVWLPESTPPGAPPSFARAGSAAAALPFLSGLARVDLVGVASRPPSSGAGIISRRPIIPPSQKRVGFSFPPCSFSNHPAPASESFVLGPHSDLSLSTTVGPQISVPNKCHGYPARFIEIIFLRLHYCISDIAATTTQVAAVCTGVAAAPRLAPSKEQCHPPASARNLPTLTAMQTPAAATTQGARGAPAAPAPARRHAKPPRAARSTMS